MSSTRATTLIAALAIMLCGIVVAYRMAQRSKTVDAEVDEQTRRMIRELVYVPDDADPVEYYTSDGLGPGPPGFGVSYWLPGGADREAFTETLRADLLSKGWYSLCHDLTLPYRQGGPDRGWVLHEEGTENATFLWTEDWVRDDGRVLGTLLTDPADGTKEKLPIGVHLHVYTTQAADPLLDQYEKYHGLSWESETQPSDAEPGEVITSEGK